MSTVVIMPGGFHPFHAGHASLYQDALKAFPGADVYVAATNDTKTRPFPFAIKEKLAKVAGVAPGHFVQVKSPFQAREITQNYNPEQDVLIFVRSEKDKTEQPKPGGTKKDGTPAYFQPWTGKNVQPFSKHAYMAYLPTVEFGPGITSATEIRNAWPTLNDRRKTAMVMSLYPATQKNPKLAANVVKMLDMGMGNELDEGMSRRGFLKGLGASAIAGASGNAMAQFANMHKDDPLVQHNKDIDELAKAIYATMVAQRGEPMDRSQQRMWMTIAREKATIKLSQHAPGRPQPQSSSGFPTQGSERKVSKDINNFESKKINEFAQTDSGDEKSYLLQLADDLADAMYGPNKNKQEVKNVSGKILAAGGNVKISWNDDSTFNVVMYHPVYFKQGHLIRLVGKGDQEITEGPFVQRLGRPNKVNIYVRHTTGKPSLLIATDIPYTLYDKFIAKAMQKYPQFRQTDFSFKSADKQGMAEGDVVPFKQPSKTLTWQQVPKDVLLLANDWFWASEDNSGLDATIDPEGFGNGTANDVKYNAAKLQQKGWTIDFNDEYDGPGEFNLRLTNKRGQTVLLSIEDAQDFTGWAEGTNQGLHEFASSGSDDREPDEEEILRQLAIQWWNGSIQQMKKAQQTLQAMGWDIGQDESGDEDAGVFVIRIGDEHGDSYIAFPHSELSLDDINEDYLDEN